jgi:hypothetical protein
MAPEPPRVTCRITPVADICRDRPCLTERLREGATGSKATGYEQQRPEARKVRGLSEPGFRRHWSVSVTHRFLRPNLKSKNV